VISIAHVGGMPVEELLPFAPVVWVAIALSIDERLMAVALASFAELLNDQTQQP
jgi:hypothetical protein